MLSGVARRPAATEVVRALLAALVIGTVSVALLSRQSLAPNDALVLTIDARARIGHLVPIWDETNLWKLDTAFGSERTDVAAARADGWLVRGAPWLRFARVNAVLGGNYAPEIAPWCDHAVASDAHPEPSAAECGKNGTPGPAARNELVRRVGDGLVVDYTPLHAAVARLLRSGVMPHLNISAAPAAFTGGVVDFGFYHWNGAPVTDLDAWSAFVTGAFAALADLGTDGWRVSIVNEPNCLTLVGPHAERRHVGFAGTPDDYARTFVTTARAIRKSAPGVKIHAGNYVTSATFPGEDNLAVYLSALRGALDAAGDVRWEDLPFVSLSLYETRDTTLYEFLPKRVARLEAAESAAGLALKPVKIDELEIHDEVRVPFEQRHGGPLDATLFAASWHAEAQRAFVASGKVGSTSGWLSHAFADDEALVPFPKVSVYAMLGLLAGELTAHDDGGRVSFAPSGRHRGLARLAVAGERVWSGASQPRHGERGSAAATHRIERSLGALATRSHDSVRVLVVHHQNKPVPDDSLLRTALARPVALAFAGLPPGAWQARALAVGGDGGVRWDGAQSSPLRWQDWGCTRADGGRLALAPRVLAANAVWLVELDRRARCP